MSLLVMKFGGTSLGTPQAMQKAAAIVCAQAREQKVVVVVSALAGITNQLVESANSAPADRELVGAFTRKFLERHLRHLADLTCPNHTTKLPARRSITTPFCSTTCSFPPTSLAALTRPWWMRLWHWEN